jgi:hypothetical protein
MTQNPFVKRHRSGSPRQSCTKPFESNNESLRSNRRRQSPAQSYEREERLDRSRAECVQGGNPRLSTMMGELVWLWLQNQPTSALSLWFHERVRRLGGDAHVPANVMVPADGSRGSFTVTNHYNGRPKAVKITAAYSGASAADTLTVPTPPPRHCPPRQCPSHSRISRREVSETAAIAIRPSGAGQGARVRTDQRGGFTSADRAAHPASPDGVC